MAGIEQGIAEVCYEGRLAFHDEVQPENIEAPHPWPVPCAASGTSIVIDHDGNARACGLRRKLPNLRNFDCHSWKFWETRTRQEEADCLLHDWCECTRVCFINDSLRYSPKALLTTSPSCAWKEGLPTAPAGDPGHSEE